MRLRLTGGSLQWTADRRQRLELHDGGSQTSQMAALLAGEEGLYALDACRGGCGGSVVKPGIQDRLRSPL